MSEISKQSNGQVHLQEQLLSDILKKKNIEVNNVDQGINMIKERLRNKRVLMVLDDVDELEQLTMLAILKHDWIGLGSRIIITTRDEQLLKVIEVDDTYMLKELNDAESLELFSWHAFRRSHPKENYVELSKDIVRYCDGLPLALEVVGSLLFKSDASDWESTLKQLREIPPKKIQKKLRISYDRLEHDKQKDIFLHIACFFVGVDKDYALAILNACGFCARSGISALIRKCLLKINDQNKLTMHDLVRDMGREIVREECRKEPGNRSRLWSCNDVLDVLRKRKGTEAVEGLILKLPTLNEEHLSTEAFANMCNLRLLQLNYVYFTGSYDHFSKDLRWVCWHGFPLNLIPKNFHLENLVVLDMRYSKLREFSKEIKKLKVLNLSHSYHLTKTPNFSKIPNLHMLKLKGCTSLVKVHPSIGDLHRLVLLDMRDCKQLKNLPTSICQLKTLEILNLSGCSMFERLPKDVGDMEALNELHIDGTQALASKVHLKNIMKLSLGGCTGLTSRSSGSVLWSWVSRRESLNSLSLQLPSLLALTSLRRLELKDCNLSDDVIPKDFGSLSSLEYLDLSRNNFCCLPARICNLHKLEVLNFGYCTRLLSLPKLPANLIVLKAKGCISLERLPNVGRFKSSELVLNIENCPKLVVIPGFEEYCSNGSLNLSIHGCNNILASTLMENIPQNPHFLLVYVNKIPSRFRHQSRSPSLSLKVTRYFEDAVLDVCVLLDFKPLGCERLWMSRYGGLVLRNGNQLEVVIRPNKVRQNFSKCGVCLYDRSEGVSIQSNSVNEILSCSNCGQNTMISSGGGDYNLCRTYLEYCYDTRNSGWFDVDINIIST